MQPYNGNESLRNNMNKHNLFWGALLILAGVLFLGNNLNWFSIRPQLIFPIVLIALGIYTLLSRQWPDDQNSIADSIQIPLEGAKRAELRLTYGAGKFSLSGGGSGTQLLSGSGSVQHSARREGDTLRVRLEHGLTTFFPWNWNGAQRLKLQLNAKTPAIIKLECGAADSTLDLRDTQVQEIEIETGASSTTLVMPQRAGHTRAKISGGAANFDITVPEGVAARISVESGLGSVMINEQRFPRNLNAYQSVDYDKAANTLELMIEVGLSSVQVK